MTDESRNRMISIDLYERMMNNARIPTPIIQHMKTRMTMNCSNKKGDKSHEPNVSYKLFKEIASTRKFDQYGQPIM